LARIRKNDTVMVIAGKERGKTGKVLRILPGEGRAVVERLNIVKRHYKPRGTQNPGGIVEKEAPIALANLMPLCEKCAAPVRVGARTVEEGRKVRVCRRCGELLDR
jgi:large subunit ribosomal protein L24